MKPHLTGGHLTITWVGYVITLSIHYIQMELNYGKNVYWTSFLCVQMGTYSIFLQQLLFCEEILLEKYPVWQLTMPSCSVATQNFPNTNVIVNYHILIICNWSGYGYFNFHSNWQIFVRCWAYNMKWIAIPNTLFAYAKKTYFCGILIQLTYMPKICTQKFHLDVVNW